MWAEGKLEEGATFLFYFSTEGAGMNEGKVEILLIEDNPADLELTLHALRKRNLANNVKILTDGQEALDYISNVCSIPDATECPHLIMLDLKLPKVSGLEVLEAIPSQ